MAKSKMLFHSAMLYTLYTFYLILCSSILHASDPAIHSIDLNQTYKAVQKVKLIFQTMQAREKDFVAAHEAFIAKLKDPDSNMTEKLDFIDPFWSSFKGNQGSCETTKERLRQKVNHKKALIEVATTMLAKDTQRAKNAYQGFQVFLNMCDSYLDPETEDKFKILSALLDSLLQSHLFGLRNTVEAFMPLTGSNRFSHISLKQEELDIHYTQDSRLHGLSELYYIVDYIHPLALLLKLGLQPDKKDWGFCDNLQKYIKGSITLEDPSLFLIDGYLYHKGIEKAGKSSALLSVFETLNSTTDTGGVLDSDMIQIEPLTDDEKGQAIVEYTQRLQLHQERVRVYIKNLTEKNRENINKSKAFIEHVLLGELTYTTKSTITIASPTSPSDLEFEKRKKKRHKKKKKGPAQRTSSTITSPLSTTSTETTEMATPETPMLNTGVIVEKDEDLEEEQETVTEVKLPSSETSSKPQKQQKQPLKPKKGNDGPKDFINNRHNVILRELLDPTTKPFTIDYTKALNAMSKVGITELKSKRKGDFRKLVRRDSNDNVIGKVFAYKPATSMLGNELMKIYRAFIEQQKKDRTDLNFN